MAEPYALTVDGFESQFGTNHVGPFLSTNLIRPRLAAVRAPRVVVGVPLSVSSNLIAESSLECVLVGSHISDVRYDDPGFSAGEASDNWLSYGQSKTANILFTVGLAERGIEAFALHPGGECGDS